jgi:hypothetical protein
LLHHEKKIRPIPHPKKLLAGQVGSKVKVNKNGSLVKAFHPHLRVSWKLVPADCWPLTIPGLPSPQSYSDLGFVVAVGRQQREVKGAPLPFKGSWSLCSVSHPLQE